MTDSRKPAFGFWARSILVVGLLLVVLSFFGDEALGSNPLLTIKNTLFSAHI